MKRSSTERNTSSASKGQKVTLGRRTFIAGSTVGVLSMGLGSWLPEPLRHDLRRADFAGLKDRDFRVRAATGRTFHCTLEAIAEGPRVPGLDQFTLVFERSDGRFVSAGLYELRNAELQRFPLHLAPTGGTGSNRFFAHFGQHT
jgi:hypothetical protein